MYTTYILLSQKDNRFYIGCTLDLTARLYRHNNGWVNSTRCRRPFRLIYFEKFETLSEARKRENYLKSLKGGNEFKKVITRR